MPYHSFLISAFNRFEYLAATVESCLASTDTDFEILIIDDGSCCEDADPFYDRLLSLDPRIRVIRDGINKGVGTRFAELHMRAKGKLLHLLGSDDLCHPERLRISKYLMNNSTTYNTILCGQAKHLSSNYRLIPSASTYAKGCEIKAAMFFQPLVLHPTVTTWHPDLSNFIQYRARMRAAVDYCYYVDNYFESRFLSVDQSLVYLVHSSTGITRDAKSRCNQLAMHDYAMYKLWSSFVKCSMYDVAAIRSLVVTSEYPQVDFSKYSREDFTSLISLLFAVKTNVLSALSKDKVNIFSSFIATDAEQFRFSSSLEKYFDHAAHQLKLVCKQLAF